MTLLGRLMALYPTCLLLLLLGLCLWFGARPSVVQPGLMVLILYVLPPVTHRLHSLFFPLREKTSDLSKPEYCPWWGSHQIQVLYIALPGLEAVLRLVPGLYSAWLRLWGARIGKNVYWTPLVQITDRTLIEIGDHVLIGHKVEFLCHVIKPNKSRMVLYLKKIKVGNNVFLGAGSRLAPGVVIEDGVYLPILSDIYPNQKVKRSPADPLQNEE